MVVDDDEVVRRALERNLRRLGCQVLLATNGEEALVIAAHWKPTPAVIFLDIQMTGMDGHAVLRRLSAEAVTSSVVVMSGHGDIDDVIQAMRSGAVDYLKKPWTATTLASALARAIEVFNAVNQSNDYTTTATEGANTPRALLRLPARPGVSGAPGTAPAEVTVDVVPLAFVADALGSGARSGLVAPPPLPRAVVRLRELARRPAPVVDEIVATVEADEAVATAVMRLANGSAYFADGAAETLSTAISRIGVRQVHALAETLLLRSWFPARGAVLRAAQERVWRYSVARGLAMQAIAEISGPEIGLDGHSCYLTGLFLDVGALYLLGVLDQQGRARPRNGPAPQDERPDPLAALAPHHGATGQALLLAWGIDSEIAALAASHHSETTPVSESFLWCAALCAGPLAARLAGEPDPTHVQPQRPELLESCAYTLGMGETVLRRLASALAKDMDEVWALYA